MSSNLEGIYIEAHRCQTVDVWIVFKKLENVPMSHVWCYQNAQTVPAIECETQVREDVGMAELAA